MFWVDSSLSFWPVINFSLAKCNPPESESASDLARNPCSPSKLMLTFGQHQLLLAKYTNSDNESASVENLSCDCDSDCDCEHCDHGSVVTCDQNELKWTWLNECISEISVHCNCDLTQIASAGHAVWLLLLAEISSWNHVLIAVTVSLKLFNAPQSDLPCAKRLELVSRSRSRSRSLIFVQDTQVSVWVSVTRLFRRPCSELLAPKTRLAQILTHTRSGVKAESQKWFPYN